MKYRTVEEWPHIVVTCKCTLVAQVCPNLLYKCFRKFYSKKDWILWGICNYVPYMYKRSNLGHIHLQRFWGRLDQWCEWTTCRSSVESLVSGFVLPFSTISVLDMNPDAESTSIPSGTSTSPDPDTFKRVLFQDHFLYKGIVTINQYKRWDYSAATMAPPSDQKAHTQLFSYEPSKYYKAPEAETENSFISKCCHWNVLYEKIMLRNNSCFHHMHSLFKKLKLFQVEFFLFDSFSCPDYVLYDSAHTKTKGYEHGCIKILIVLIQIVFLVLR